MNFLAHLYLSGDSEDIMTGNFIGDYVKGTKFDQYQGDIRRGILLHRAIDDFTDRNIYFREARKLFGDYYGRYSGIVTDVVFDHFLANQWPVYSKVRLRDFTRLAHAVLLSRFLKLPFRVQQFLPFMIQHRRLESYATLQGMEKALRIMSDYTSLPPRSHQASEVVNIHHDMLQELFGRFMVEITDFVEQNHQISLDRPGNQVTRS
ncbi:MAG: ACP phosphodiesterase [Bacteroidota bacterium]